MRYSVAETAEKWGLDKEVARAQVRVLEEIGQARCMGERRPANGRGRAELVFEFQRGYEKFLAGFLARAKLAD